MFKAIVCAYLNASIRTLLKLGSFKSKLDFGTAWLDNLVGDTLGNETIVGDTGVGRIQRRVSNHVRLQLADLQQQQQQQQ